VPRSQSQTSASIIKICFFPVFRASKQFLHVILYQALVYILYRKLGMDYMRLFVLCSKNIFAPWDNLQAAKELFE